MKIKKRKIFKKENMIFQWYLLEWNEMNFKYLWKLYFGNLLIKKVTKKKLTKNFFETI